MTDPEFHRSECGILWLTRTVARSPGTCCPITGGPTSAVGRSGCIYDDPSPNQPDAAASTGFVSPGHSLQRWADGAGATGSYRRELDDAAGRVAGDPVQSLADHHTRDRVGGWWLFVEPVAADPLSPL